MKRADTITSKSTSKSFEEKEIKMEKQIMKWNDDGFNEMNVKITNNPTTQWIRYNFFHLPFVNNDKPALSWLIVINHKTRNQY